MTPTEQAVIDLQEWPNRENHFTSGYVASGTVLYRWGRRNDSPKKLCTRSEFEQTRARLIREGRLTMETEWKDGLPPVGWHGEVTWGCKADWWECVLLPDGQVALRLCKRTFKIRNLDSLDSREFRPIRSEREERIERARDIIMAIIADDGPGMSRRSAEALEKAGMLRLPDAELEKEK